MERLHIEGEQGTTLSLEDAGDDVMLSMKFGENQSLKISFNGFAALQMGGWLCQYAVKLMERNAKQDETP